MHPHAALIQRLYGCLARSPIDHAAMAACYHPDAAFRDIAFTLAGRKQIHAMWHLIAGTDLTATFTGVRADDAAGAADLTDVYTYRDTGRRVVNVIHSEFRFRDGLIVGHVDTCSALRWGVQALGPVKGVLSWVVPAARRRTAMKKLTDFIAAHPEYAR